MSPVPSHCNRNLVLSKRQWQCFLLQPPAGVGQWVLPVSHCCRPLFITSPKTSSFEYHFNNHGSVSESLVLHHGKTHGVCNSFVKKVDLVSLMHITSILVGQCWMAGRVRVQAKWAQPPSGQLGVETFTLLSVRRCCIRGGR